MLQNCAPICATCGQPASRAPGPTARQYWACRNPWCTNPRRALAAVYWAGAYQRGLRKAIVAYKYRADLRWAPAFGRLLYAFLVKRASWFEEYGLLCPVPSYSGPGARRPWGHIELVCAELAQRAGAQWPVEQLVLKSAETPPLSARARSQRHRIASSALATALYVTPGAQVAGRKVLVIDDVCASGETLLAMAKVLRDAGAEEVAGLVVARASWRRP